MPNNDFTQFFWTSVHGCGNKWRESTVKDQSADDPRPAHHYRGQDCAKRSGVSGRQIFSAVKL